jgi:hypothetical protein
VTGFRAEEEIRDDHAGRRLSLPETAEEEGEFRFAVMDSDRGKFSFHTQSFVWGFKQRVHPKKPRVLQTDVVAVRVANADEKEILIASDEEKFFADPHYDGFNVVMVRLPTIDVEELEELITDAWRCLAPAALLRADD